MLTKVIEKKSSSNDIAKAYHGFYDEQVPSVIFDAIVSVKFNRVIRYAKIGTLLLAGFLIAVASTKIFQTSASENEFSINTEKLAVSAHTTFAKDIDYPVRVGVDDMNHLEKWVSKRLGKQIQIRNLDKIGYKLLGANLVPDGSRIAASIVYENQQHQRMTLFIRNSQDPNSLETKSNEQPQIGRQGGFNWISWENRQNVQVIVSEFDQPVLQNVFEYL